MTAARIYFDGAQVELGLVPLGDAPSAVAPQRLQFWRPLALVALGLLATEDYGQPQQQVSLHSFRAPVQASGGTVAHGYTQLVLVEAQQDAVRTDHNRRLLYGKTAAAAPTAGAPWYLWAQPAKQIEPEDDARRANHVALHQYRPGYQTVGQPWAAWPKPAVADQSVEPDANRADHSRLHIYRVGYQTVGQGIKQWPRVLPRIETEEYSIPKPIDLTAFRNTAPVVVTPGAPWFLWQPQDRIDAEEDIRRGPDHGALHRYRPGYQTVGQGYRILRPPAAVADQTLEADAHRKPVDLTPYRNSAPAVAVVGAPWYLWKPPIPRLDPEDDARRADHTRLHRYRTGYQTVGQSYRLLRQPSAYASQDIEPDAVRKPVDLSPFRQITTTAPIGAPWYLWAPPIKRVEPEADARRSDHTLLHRYRVGYQTVGQPFQLRPGPQKRVEAEEYTVPPLSNFALTRVTQATAIPGQPWCLWPVADADQSAEEDARRSDHGQLHRYRVGYQTVAQSWQYWIKPQKRVDEEAYTVPGPASLAPFRQITVTVAPGQPWWMWPAAIADQTVEPNPVVTDHAKAIYPFRPHDAISVQVVALAYVIPSNALAGATSTISSGVVWSATATNAGVTVATATNEPGIP